jgi:hypothetical protein
MTQEHPIAPPPELIKDWHDEWNESDQIVHSAYTHIATRAAQWGADQELEACRTQITDGLGRVYIEGASNRVLLAEDIWTARRPKPPSLKAQALQELKTACKTYDLRLVNLDTIRRALEQLPDNE